MESNPHIVQEIRRLEEQYSFRPDSLVFGRLADLHRKAGNPERALEILEEGLRRHPRYLSAHIVRARCLHALDRVDEAREAFEDVLRIDGQNLVALRSLAEIARERGEAEEARRRLEAMLQVDPRNEEARDALQELEETVAAASGAGPEEPADLRAQVAELELDEPTEGEEGDLATRTLAGLYETQGFYREAVEMYERLLEERPESEAAEIRERLERARAALAEAGVGPAPAPDSPSTVEPEVAEPTAEPDPDVPEEAAEPGSHAAVPSTGSDGGPPSAAEHLRALLRGEASRSRTPRPGRRDGRPSGADRSEGAGALP